MKRKVTRFLDHAVTLLRRTLASKNFLYLILVIAIIQGLWYALSFKPWIYDEARHFENIQIYTEQLSPFLTEQKAEWDRLGQVTRDASYLFYYLMSWPLRFLQIISSDVSFHIIGLRFVGIAIFTTGLIFLHRALRLVTGISGEVVNLALLLFVLTPAVGFLAGIITYDSVAFLLFSILLLLSLRMLSTSKPNPQDLVNVTILSLLLGVVKWSAIALAAPVMAVCFWWYIQRYKKESLINLKNSMLSASIFRRIVVIVLLVISIGLFIERPVMNTISYGRPSPGCQKVLTEDRCQKFNDYAIYSNLKKHKDPNFSAVNPIRYVSVYWWPTMSNTMTNLLERGGSTQLPVAVALSDLIFTIFTLLILVYLTVIVKDKKRLFILAIIVFYIGLLLFEEYGAYQRNALPVAIRARYLIPVLPLYFVLALYSAQGLFGKYRKTVAATLIVVAFMLTQGWGFVTYNLTTPESAYWSDPAKNFNQGVKQVLEPVVKE